MRWRYQATCGGSLLVVVLVACGQSEELALNAVAVQAGSGPAANGNQAGSVAGGGSGTSAIGSVSGATTGGSSAGAGTTTVSDCVKDADCPAELGLCEMTRHVCVQCRTTNDCTSLAEVCDVATLRCTPQCDASHGCETDDLPFCSARGTCVACLSDTDCEDGKSCEELTNTCRECITSSDCGINGVCDRTSGECQDEDGSAGDHG